jgi:type III pantothenate kinase
MILLLDAGNTRLKWGLRAGKRWQAQGVLDYTALDTLPQCWSQRAKPVAVWAVNVAGETTAQALQSRLAQQGIALHFVRAQAQGFGVVNHYHTPQQLGADRWAALIGARTRHTGPALVVCAGTATTVDVLDASGDFLGGLIAPGLDLMRRSLAQGTAGLPLAQSTFQALPRSTEEAIITGCLAAQLGAVRHGWRQIESRPDARCILSGGAAESLRPHLELPLIEVPYLVLEGLARIAEDAAFVGGLPGMR